METENDYRVGQKVIATIVLQDDGQDFTELDVLKNGVILGNSVMFSHGRLSLLGIGTNDGMEYYEFAKFSAMKKLKPKGLIIYMKNTGDKDPLPWKATTLKYPIVAIKKAKNLNRFIKK